MCSSLLSWGRALGVLLLPPAYASGTPFSEFSVYAGATLASLGLTPGLYVWSWGSGAHADTFTIDILADSGSEASPVPELSTWAMILVGFAGLGYASLRRKTVVAAISA